MNTASRGTMALPVSPVHAAEIPPNVISGMAAGTACNLSSSVICSMSNLMRPLFHFTLDDAVILAMEHNNHSKLLAVSTSRNELYVTSTCNMPLDDAQATNEGQLKWDPAEATVLIDHLQYPCTYLAWGPWQHGTYLACVCRGKQVRLYRLSHGNWSLDEIIIVPDCNFVAFSFHFTLACVTSKGKLLIFAQTIDNEINKWSSCSMQLLERDGCNVVRPFGSHSRTVKGYTCVGWDETGNLLAVGDDEGCFSVLHVSNKGRDLGEIAYTSDSLSDRGKGIRQVSWSPGAGRSFLVLAVVTSHGVTVLLFRRPRVQGIGDDTDVRVSEGTPLNLISHTTAKMEGVTELSWNTSGMRFVTAHTDGRVSVWALWAHYSRGQRVPFNEAEEGVSSSSSGGVGTQHVNASRHLDGLRLTASGHGTASDIYKQY